MDSTSETVTDPKRKTPGDVSTGEKRKNNFSVQMTQK